MSTVHQRRQTGDTFAGYNDLEVTVCTCGVLFAVPEKMLDQRRDDGQTFYCPHGHRLFFGNTTLDKTKARADREAARAGRLAAERDQLQASLSAQRAATTRIKNQRDHERKRTAAGVCPCCNRTFKQLARHIKSQHPDFPHEVES